ncbi:MAG: hypothetical protein ABIH23_11220 [bacterium]
MKLFVRVLHSEKIPRFYGMAWPMSEYYAWICAPIPLNKIAGILRRLWFALRMPILNKWDREMCRLRSQLKAAEWAVERVKETEQMRELYLEAIGLVGIKLEDTLKEMMPDASQEGQFQEGD